MIVCPVCKFRNPDANERCFKCAALLKRNDAAMRDAAAAVKRRPVGERLRLRFGSPLDWLRHQEWWRRLTAIPDDMPLRYPFTAGLLSMLLPGAGHWYSGQKHKAVVLFLIGLPFLVIALLTITQPWSNFVLAGLVTYYLLIWTDSVAVATRVNGNPWRPRKKAQ